MEFNLKWGYVARRATIDDHGLLKYDCPFCGQPTSLGPELYRRSGNTVRTTMLVMCEYPDCGIPYEIVHSYFVPLKPRDIDRWHLYRRWYLPGAMHGVWKTRNERHQ